jgi:hypothetical protein
MPSAFTRWGRDVGTKAGLRQPVTRSHATDAGHSRVPKYQAYHDIYVGVSANRAVAGQGGPKADIGMRALAAILRPVRALAAAARGNALGS